MSATAIRGLVILPRRAPRYYTSGDTGERYTMFRIIGRLGYMSFSYSLEKSVGDTNAFIHDLERHANSGGSA